MKRPPPPLDPGALYLPRPNRCTGCAFPPAVCICASLPYVPCRTRLIVVRHASERHKASNTGGLAARVVGAERLDHGLPGQRIDLTDRLGHTPRLLLPHGSERVDELPSAVVILDATWHQARAMRARIPPLPTVPLLSLPPQDARPRMRLQHLPEGRSTMEAMADVLELLGEPEPARALRELFADVTARWLALRQATGI